MTLAQERYTAYLSSILDRLIKLQNWKSRQLDEAERRPIDWRDVGDAAHIDDLLAMACEFLEMEPEAAHPNHAGVKYAVYLSPKQGEAAMILGDGSVNAGIVKALDLADHVGEARRLQEAIAERNAARADVALLKTSVELLQGTVEALQAQRDFLVRTAADSAHC